MVKVLALFVALSSLSLVKSCGTVLDAFKRHELIPDVLDEGPNSLLKVVYPSFPSSLVVRLGNKLTVASVQVQPTISWVDAKPDSYYTLAMMDPDAPSRLTPTNRNVNHWLVGNIKGNNLNDFSGASVMAVYRGSGPPVDSGYHRYSFYLFEQTANIIDFSDTVVEARGLFSLKNFVDKYKLGTPLAGCFYQARNAANEDKLKK